MAQYYSSEAMAWLKMANRWPNTEAPMNELASCIASTQNITHTLYSYVVHQFKISFQKAKQK
jgi:hypothetical protein